MSNTSNGLAQKGSKYWVQTLVNLNNGTRLTQEIQKADPTIGDITWRSPLAMNDYAEYKLKNQETMKELGLNAKDLDFWPGRQPQWDAIGTVNNMAGGWNTLVLVEAKAHISEINTPCRAKAQSSIDLINTSLKETHDGLIAESYNHTFEQALWAGKYYQVGNRLAFLHKLREKNYSVILVFLNIVNDPTLIQTTETEWSDHYKSVFTQMLGFPHPPKDVLVINMSV